MFGLAISKVANLYDNVAIDEDLNDSTKNKLRRLILCIRMNYVDEEEVKFENISDIVEGY